MHHPGAVRSQPTHQFFRRKWPAEKISLRAVTIFHAQKIQLFLSFYPFSDHLHAKFMGHFNRLLNHDAVCILAVYILDK